MDGSSLCVISLEMHRQLRKGKRGVNSEMIIYFGSFRIHKNITFTEFISDVMFYTMCLFLLS